MPENNFQVLPDEGMRVGWPGPANHWARAEARGEITSAPEVPEGKAAPDAKAAPKKADAPKAPQAHG
jgi:hypothetical protein